MSKKPKTCGECDDYFVSRGKVFDFELCRLDGKIITKDSTCHHNPIQFKSKKKGEKK